MCWIITYNKFLQSWGRQVFLWADICSEIFGLNFEGEHTLMGGIPIVLLHTPDFQGSKLRQTQVWTTIFSSMALNVLVSPHFHKERESKIPHEMLAGLKSIYSGSLIKKPALGRKRHLKGSSVLHLIYI